MAQANFPENEQERLRALYSYELLDRDVDAVFDTIIRTAADVCDVDISVIALIDQDRQYFLARNGMQPRETPRAIAFCAHAILEPGKTFEIPDATKDPRFADNPLVTGEIGVRFYAAQPLTNREGHAIGGLCLIGKEPKVLNDIQRQTLKNLGSVTMALIESRKSMITNTNSLIKSEAQLRAIFDNSPFCLNLKDIEGNLLFANKNYREWWGRSAEEIIGKKTNEIRTDSLSDKIIIAAEKAVLETGEPYESENRVKSPRDGQLHDRLLTKFAVKSPDGSIMGLGTCSVDITDRKRAEEELVRHRDHLQELVDTATQELKAKATELELALAKEQELNKLQREFVSMASHEFRTPLAIIDATAQRMKSRANKNRLTPEDAVRRSEKIRTAVQRMTRLMESTLDAARMEEGVIKVEIEPCDICKVVREVCSRQQEISKDHVISCNLTDVPATIQADSSSLDQVFTNLLSNAVKYAPDAPDIEVKVHKDGPQVVISVRDYGIGIDEDDLSRIGERFFRARTSTGTTGTGIGLTLAKTLVEMHGGTVSVESQKGEGSTFTIRLPIAGPDQSEKVDTKVA